MPRQSVKRKTVTSSTKYVNHARNHPNRVDKVVIPQRLPRRLWTAVARRPPLHLSVKQAIQFILLVAQRRDLTREFLEEYDLFTQNNATRLKSAADYYKLRHDAGHVYEIITVQEVFKLDAAEADVAAPALAAAQSEEGTVTRSKEIRSFAAWAIEWTMGAMLNGNYYVPNGHQRQTRYRTLAQQKFQAEEALRGARIHVQQANNRITVLQNELQNNHVSVAERDGLQQQLNEALRDLEKEQNVVRTHQENLNKLQQEIHAEAIARATAESARSSAEQALESMQRERDREAEEARAANNRLRKHQRTLSSVSSKIFKAAIESYTIMYKHHRVDQQFLNNHQLSSNAAPVAPSPQSIMASLQSLLPPASASSSSSSQLEVDEDDDIYFSIMRSEDETN